MSVISVVGVVASGDFPAVGVVTQYGDQRIYATLRVSEAFVAFFADNYGQVPEQTTSEDFTDIPRAVDAPYTYWGIGGIDPVIYGPAVEQGRVNQDVPVNHSPLFAPVISRHSTPAHRLWWWPRWPGWHPVRVLCQTRCGQATS